MKLDSYKNKLVLVTGAAGFIGSHLVEELLARGAQVRALYRYNSRNSMGWLEGFRDRPNLELCFGDVTDSGMCNDLVNGVSDIFHLAALIGIPYSYLAPSSYFSTNLEGTLNIANAWKRFSPNAVFVQMSTSEVYGSATYTPMDETHVLQPQSPYSASKIAADALVTSFGCTYDLPTIIVRPFNNYGPRQSGRAVIPTIIQQVLGGKGKISLGNIDSVRDFIYVQDTCRILADIAVCQEAIGKVINIGTGQSVSIEQLCNLIADIVGAEVVVESEMQRTRPTKSEVTELLCDNRRLRNVLGNVDLTELRVGLSKTIEWFGQNSKYWKTKNIGNYDV